MTTLATRNTMTFTDSLPDSSDELEAVVRAERKQLKASIEELGSAMRDKVNVRKNFREHPLATVGVGFAAGLALGILSGRARSGSRRSRAGEDAYASEPRRGSGGLGKFGATVLGMVGARVADLAEDTLRSSLSRKSFSMPSRRPTHSDES